ncbi:MAG: peptidylprolyl isomerase [Bryobacteraceae bacterium]
MKRSIFVFLAFSGASLLFSQALAPAAKPGSAAQTGLQIRGPENVAQQDPQRVVATIDGKPVTAKQALGLLNELPANQKSRAGNNLDQVLEQMYMLDHFSGEAERSNLQNQQPWQQDIAFTRERILAQAYLQRLTAAGSPEANAAQQYYNVHPNEFQQVKLSGILVGFAPPGTPSKPGRVVRTEEQARARAEDIEKKLKAGANFATLARTDSDNPESASKGGDLGTIDLDAPNLPPTIKTAVAALPPGQLSDPVQVRGGFYIFKVISRTKRPFSQVRAQIIMQKIYARYKIDVKDPAFFSGANPEASSTPSLAHPAGSAPPPPPGIPAKPSPSHR